MEPNIRRNPDKPATEPNVGQAERLLSGIVGTTLLLFALRRPKTAFGLSIAALGSGMLWRGATGRCSVYRALDVDTQQADYKGIEVHATVTVQTRPQYLYDYWRNLENLPKIMSHLEAVKVLDETHSHWVAKAPAGQTVSWDAEITSAIEGREIRWRSLEGAQVWNEGSVEFIPVSGNRGTEVHVNLTYRPPAGLVGATIAWLFGEEPHKQIEDDLVRFQQFMETGETATTQNQPSGPSAKRQVKSLMMASAVSRQEKNGNGNGDSANGHEPESILVGVEGGTA